MRFCMVTTFYPPYHFGGDGTYVRALSEALVERGHEVTVVHCEDAYRLSGAEQSSDDFPSAVRVIRLKSRLGLLSPLLTQQTGFPVLKHAELANILGDNYDVVNFHNISLVGGPAVIPLSNARVNLYTLHEHWLLCPTHIFWKNTNKACDKRQCFRCSIKSGIPPQLWRYTGLIRNSIKNIDCFIAPSQFTAEQHRAGGITQPIKVLPLFSYLSPSEIIDESTDEMQFITVGRVTASKGIAELVQAFSHWPEYRLQVVGVGDQLVSLKQAYGACDNIEFLGQLPQKSLESLYRQAKALILPSLAPETFGLTVVEAFACAVPAIVRIAGGNRETIDNSGAGFLYSNDQELKSALESFQCDREQRSRLGRLARQAYERDYTQAVHIDRYLELVSGLMAASGKMGGGEHVGGA